MNTAFLLMARYDARPIIPVETVCRDYFPHLVLDNFIRKASVGDIKLPLVRVDAGSKKGARGVHLQDLAAFIDARRAEAEKELKQLISARES